jgi:hypothetical protein
LYVLYTSKKQGLVGMRGGHDKLLASMIVVQWGNLPTATAELCCHRKKYPPPPHIPATIAQKPAVGVDSYRRRTKIRRRRTKTQDPCRRRIKPKIIRPKLRNCVLL